MNPSGAVVPNAKASARNTTTEVVQTVTTAVDEALEFPTLRVGVYDLTMNDEPNQNRLEVVGFGAIVPSVE